MSHKTKSSLGCSPFVRLPAELRLKVWEAACPAPSMHIFDLCLPSASSRERRGSGTSHRAFDRTDKDSERYARFEDVIYLDKHRGDQRSPSDPSMYRQRMALEAVCFDASLAVAVPSLPRRPGGRAASTSVAPSSACVFTSDVNTVYLPGPDRHVYYDNRTDVLHLCFSKACLASGAAGIAPKIPCAVLQRVDGYDNFGHGSVLSAQWNDEAAETIRTASRIALDAADVVSMVGGMEKQAFEDDIMFLASMMQQGLEVLYLVDYCVGHCRRCGRHQIGSGELARSDGTLSALLHGNAEGFSSDEERYRQLDVVWGVGRVYREVLDLEGMGWTCDSLVFQFAQAIGNAVREQQRYGTRPCQFKGVRVLVAEDQ